MNKKNTTTWRVSLDDKDWMEEIIYARKHFKIDKKKMPQSRAIKAMRNIIEGDPNLLRKFKELPLR